MATNALRVSPQDLLDGLHADALDCFQTSIAVLVDGAHGNGTHALLGAPLRWDPGHCDGLRGFVRGLDDRLRDAYELAGIRVADRHEDVDGPRVRRMLGDDAGHLYVVADAYDLSWVPYAGHRHMGHSFLLEQTKDGYTVTDAYHNDTEWGPARPGVWTLTATELDRALAGAAAVLRLEPADSATSADETVLHADNAERAAAASPGVDAYLEAARHQVEEPRGADQLVLDVWLLARERSLHAIWLDGLPGRRRRADAAEALAADWRGLATRSYVAMRRSRRGAPRMGAVVEDLEQQLRADVAFGAGSTADEHGHRSGGTAASSDVRDVVVATLSEVLGVEGNSLDGATALRDLPGFDSFRLVEVLEGVEERLGVELHDRIDAADLRDVDALYRLFAAAPGDR
jgi:acyl carrier protein